MKTLLVLFLALSLAARAGETSQRVSLRTAEMKYVTASASLTLDLSGVKVGSKQTFTLLDANGGALADGDSVTIRYIPNTAGAPDESKASYWTLAGETVKRGSSATAFKLRKMEARYAFETADGKYITPKPDGALALTAAAADALKVEITTIPGAK